MESKPNNLFIKITSWITYVLLPCFMQSVIILPSQIEMLKKANETGLPVILLPLHRSHMDYSIITFLHVMHGIKCPLIAAGDNLKMPFFGYVINIYRVLNLITIPCYYYRNFMCQTGSFCKVWAHSL